MGEIAVALFTTVALPRAPDAVGGSRAGAHHEVSTARRTAAAVKPALATDPPSREPEPLSAVDLKFG